MDYALATFDGYSFGHIAAYYEHLRLQVLRKRALDIICGLR